MKIYYIPEVYVYIFLVFGIMSAVFIILDLFLVRKNMRLWAKTLWTLSALLLAWGPAFIIWIAYQLSYRDSNRVA